MSGRGQFMQTDPAHILVIDDEKLRDLLRRFLEESGFRVTDVGSADHARRMLASMEFDLLVIDVMMPGEDGVSFLRSLRGENPVPALFLTALSETENRIEGLQAGADDYMSKPFEPRELVLRITRILERQSQIVKSAGLSFGPFRFDAGSAMLMRGAQRIYLTSAELDLLSCFTNAPGQTLSRERISDLLKGRMRGRSIDVAIARLRTKLEDDPKFPVYLQTVRGTGWRLSVDNQKKEISGPNSQGSGQQGSGQQGSG